MPRAAGPARKTPCAWPTVAVSSLSLAGCSAALAPQGATLAGRRGGRLRGLVAEGNAPARQIVGRHLDGDAVADTGADAKFTHLARRIGENDVLVVELHPEIAVRQFLGDLALKLDQLFLGHG